MATRKMERRGGQGDGREPMASRLRARSDLFWVWDLFLDQFSKWN